MPRTSLFLLLLLALAACRTETPSRPVSVGPPPEEPRDQPPSLVGIYTANLPPGSPIGRHVTLTLREDGSARMETEYWNDEPPLQQTGAWRAESGRVIIALTDQEGRPVDEALQFTRAEYGLDLVDYDPASYGSEGLSLRRTENF